MSLTFDPVTCVWRAKEIRNRLRNPPNAKPDSEITMRNGSPVTMRQEAPKVLAFVPPPSPPHRNQNTQPEPRYWFWMVVDDKDDGMPPQITIAQIQRAVCKRYNVSLNDLVSPRRTGRLCRVRQIACYLCRELTTLSMPRIAKQFGDRDHTTIVHAVRKITALRKTDPDLDDGVVELIAKLTPSPRRESISELRASLTDDDLLPVEAVE